MNNTEKKLITYSETVEKPRLVISYDMYPESPRHDTNLGYFIVMSNKYESPDDNDTMKGIIIDTSLRASDYHHHMELIKDKVETSTDEKVLGIYPVMRYEHGNASYRLGYVKGYDYSNDGFYIVTDKTADELGVCKDDFDKIIVAELEIYTKWANGEIYRFELYDENGELQESCGGFYSVDDIKEGLGDEWKDQDMRDYLDM